MNLKKIQQIVFTCYFPYLGDLLLEKQGQMRPLQDTSLSHNDFHRTLCHYKSIYLFKRFLAFTKDINSQTNLIKNNNGNL
jgi:hypothetical protein